MTESCIQDQPLDQATLMYFLTVRLLVGWDWTITLIVDTSESLWRYSSPPPFLPTAPCSVHPAYTPAPLRVVRSSSPPFQVPKLDSRFAHTCHATQPRLGQWHAACSPVGPKCPRWWMGLTAATSHQHALRASDHNIAAAHTTQDGGIRRVATLGP